MSNNSIREITTQSDVSDKKRKLALEALREKKKRDNVIDRMKADSFEQQWNFITDPSKKKAVRTNRRAGKSMADAMLLLITGVTHPGCNMLYTGLTDKSAVRVIWKDCLKKLAKKYGIKVRLTIGKGIVTFEDYGSLIYLIGLDTTDAEMDKIFGAKFKLAVIDEAALYKQNIKAFVETVVEPACVDEEGTIVLSGMPCNNVKSFFFDVTNGLIPGWSLHTWSSLDNPYMAEKMRKHIAYLKTTNPGIENTPAFKQMYLGEWCVEENTLMYRYDHSKNSFDHLPEARAWYFILGIDLGYDDPSAFVVVGYRDYDPVLYVMETYKRAQMSLTEVAEQIKNYERLYRPQYMVIDTSSKQAVEEIKQRYNLNLEAAERSGKAEFINICNNDLIQGKVKFRNINCEPILKEIKVAAWEEKDLLKGKYTEPKRLNAHCLDAFLYAWRKAFNWVDRGVQQKALTEPDQIMAKYWEELQNKTDSNISEIEREYGYN